MSEDKVEIIHVPVMLSEVVEAVGIRPGGTIIDATLGMGGHSEALLRSVDDVNVIGIDRDTDAIEYANERLKPFGDRFRSYHANFSEIAAVARRAGIENADAIIADLGVSSMQFDSEIRGFSFRFDAPLDMRMDANADVLTAAELLETLSEEEIANVIYQYGDERFSRRIARRIVERRERGEPVRTTKELVELVERSVKRSPKDKIHPATRTFQALRIAVNGEIEILEQFLIDSIELLKPKGRLAVITFHSTEDRIAKQTFRKMSGICSCPPRMPICICGAEKKVEIITRRPLVPSDAETNANPRARSAKLRVIEKILLDKEPNSPA